MKNLQKFALKSDKMNQTKGKGGDIMPLLIAAWNATPEDGFSHWENTGDGSTFSGYYIGFNSEWNSIISQGSGYIYS